MSGALPKQTTLAPKQPAQTAGSHLQMARGEGGYVRHSMEQVSSIQMLHESTDTVGLGQPTTTTTMDLIGHHRAAPCMPTSNSSTYTEASGTVVPQQQPQRQPKKRGPKAGQRRANALAAAAAAAARATSSSSSSNTMKASDWHEEGRQLGEMVSTSGAPARRVPQNNDPYAFHCDSASSTPGALINYGPSNDICRQVSC